MVNVESGCSGDNNFKLKINHYMSNSKEILF